MEKPTSEKMEMGPQPLDKLMVRLNLKNNDLVAKSKDQLTFKVLMKGRKGRRLTLNAQQKILNALHAAQDQRFALSDLFNYSGKK
jgi:hypothetical protein